MSESRVRYNDKGAHFFRCDFQVHSPRDLRWNGVSCVSVSERLKYAKYLISACRKEGLDAIAITDHHDMTFIPYIKQAAASETDTRGKQLSAHELIVVFPGMEITLINTHQVIMLLDPDFDEQNFKSILDLLSIVQTPSSEPKTAKVKNIEIHLDQLAQKLDQADWLKGRYIVFPNVTNDGKHSILERGGHLVYTKMPFLGGYLDGSKSKLKKTSLEILDGKVKEWGNKSIAYIQTSDNRSENHDRLGKHSSWIKWTRPTAEALRQACLAKDSRISNGKPSLPSIFIESIKVENSTFLASFELSFNPQFNALIGGRGTGKSTIFEYIRWALCDQPSSIVAERVSNNRSRRARLIENTLTPNNASVDVTMIVNGVSHQVHRCSRDGSVSIKIAGRELQPCGDGDIRALLPIQAYSQKQLSNVSNFKDELAKFIFSPIQLELDKLQHKIIEQKEKLAQAVLNCRNRIAADASVRRLKVEKQSYEDQANQIRASLGDSSLSDRALIEEVPRLDEIANTIKSQRFWLESIGDKILEFSEYAKSIPTLAGELKSTAVNQKALAEVNDFFAKIRDNLNAIAQSIFSEYPDKKLDRWENEVDVKRKTYISVLQLLSSHKNQINKLNSLELEIRRIQMKEYGEYFKRDHYSRADEELAIEQSELVRLWAEREKLIQNQCDKLVEDSGRRIRARIFSDVTACSEGLREKFIQSGLDRVNVESVIDLFSKMESRRDVWVKILDNLRSIAEIGPKNDDTLSIPILIEYGISTEDYDKLTRSFDSNDWLDLFFIEIVSELKFECQIGQSDYIEFSQASLGQQVTSLLFTLLNQNPGTPLLIDQPEEDLDNSVIQLIANEVQSAKRHRQIIFVSHNANLVVNGDAELVASCDCFETDGRSNGRIKSEGGIDSSYTREAIVDIMEGGKAAFDLRRKKYCF